jgi:hypothetical protein
MKTINRLRGCLARFRTCGVAVTASLSMSFGFIGCKSSNSGNEHPTVHKDDAILVANRVAISAGYQIDRMKTTADESNSEWNQLLCLLPNDPSDKALERIKKRLSGREYWAIYYEPVETNRFGGDLFVFVDKRTGKVIGYLKGQ